MCGIAGFVDKKNKLSPRERENLIRRMVKKIEHRGRDGAGFFHDGNLTLGFTRLAIIDLSRAGMQPMQSADGNLLLVFNGEIYNFQDNKKQLKQYPFRTKTDSEVILAAYQKWGPAHLPRHKGMWAWAIFDKKKNELHLSIDRFGIKPLYYINNPNFFAFASEIKALLEIPGVKAELNQKALPEYLYFRHLAAPQTLFKNIFRLPPANFLSVNLKNFKIKQGEYWQLKNHKLKNKNYLKELKKLFEKSIREHLIADAPLGLQLSGGIDSSLVDVVASRIKKKHFHSFSIGLKDPGWNEFRYSRQVAKKLKTTHHEYTFTEKEFCRLLPILTYHYDEPLDHSHSVPIYILANKARRFVKVLLSGEGADETFGGYRRYENLNGKNLLMLSAFSTPEILKKIVKITIPGNFPERQKILKKYKNLSPFDRVSALDQKTYLVSLLLRQDKMGMAANLENRVPYLDHELVEFAFSLPTQQKADREQTKIILKNFAKNYLPTELVFRDKVGFGQPIAKWFKNPKGLGRYLKLFQNKKRKFFNYKQINNLIQEHLHGKKDHSQILWILINLELWLQIFIDKENSANT